MDSYELIKQMLLLQQQLNDETNGEGWESGYNKNNKIINWKRCIYMECAELIDSFAWKHWKSISAPADWDNVKVEVIDIWHFVMSLLLEHYKNSNLGDIDKITENICSTQGFKLFCKDPIANADHSDFEIINDVEKIIHLTSGFNIKLHDDLLMTYFAVALKCKVNLKELYTFYIAKNVLNKFRQDNGYKEGTYKKVWDGLEDNEVMLAILREDVHKSVDELYKSLEKRYNA